MIIKQLAVFYLNIYEVQGYLKKKNKKLLYSSKIIKSKKANIITLNGADTHLDFVQFIKSVKNTLSFIKKFTKRSSPFISFVSD
ncbi:hypothetical protein ACQCT3_08835 [Sutcliffiella horikoshii]|uniref:Uncharacterized protein n=1 Tax=Sutcliffiella horikoshii TaxID=79883 RepID=A0A5D4T5X9_9BACI|nr:hypothetical protein FZC75_13930 [Sutcliffiella horikoshii]